MKLFDSHCHLDDRAFENTIARDLNRARRQGVSAFMIAGINLASSQRAVMLAEEHDGCYAAVGVHPHDARHCSEADMAALRSLAAHPRVRAWGETGLDFNRMYSPQPVQEDWFARQLAEAAATGLPLILHERDSGGRFLEILRSQWRSANGGVVHCFSGTRQELSNYLDLGLHIGITGIITHKARGEALREMVGRIPADRLLVETDAPYLTPSPQRNQHRRNEPAFVAAVLTTLADVRGEPAAELAAVIWENTCRLFRVSGQQASG